MQPFRMPKTEDTLTWSFPVVVKVCDNDGIFVGGVHCPANFMGESGQLSK